MGPWAKNKDVRVGPGANGSCKWRISNCSSRNALIVLNAQGTSGAIGATDPFAVVGMLMPRGVTPVSGGGPSHGPRTLTK